MWHYHKQNGFVMFIVLIFMQLFVLLTGYTMEDILLLTKLIKNMESHDLLIHQAESILSYTESVIISDLPHCVIPFTESGELVSEPLTWWESQGCSGQSQTMKYYYVVESLATDSCALVDHSSNTIADYFRVTLFLYSTENQARIFLQSTVVKPRVNIPPQLCDGIQHEVQVGRQSCRGLGK